ncbi:Aste57867_21105 [Aphanomyces stellatus]|uniref:Aste57867_21105 protein n=1 Tax=Aphanomyces stellatus TaxID=120398 RepID=A0A485LGN4_9STRA|nr:hypothetical protein As57867_021037 [Aphanomyces stellatus]VFT97779.1 Aste57867_21105 [Aphanomyces stellatus]
MDVEYPKSFLAHLSTKPVNAFNIGVTILTLSLSTQLVQASNEQKELKADKEKLAARVTLLEDRLKDFGVVVLTEEEEAKAAEAEALRKVEAALQEKAKSAPKTKGVMV